MLVEGTRITATGQEATRGFAPGGAAYPLALRLSGTFRTAFPGGRPPEPGAKPKPAAAAPSAHLAQGENSVVLVADTDLLQDGAAVDVQEVFGRRIVVPSNGNLAFAQGLVEQLAAGESLLGLKSRGDLYSLWFGPRVGVEILSGRLQMGESLVDASARHFWGGLVAGMRVGFRHVHVAIELDVAYHRADGTFKGASASAEQLTLTPGGALVLSF